VTSERQAFECGAAFARALALTQLAVTAAREGSCGAAMSTELMGEGERRSDDLRGRTIDESLLSQLRLEVVLEFEDCSSSAPVTVQLRR
jgi:nitrogen regulatory protein PII